MPKMYGNPGKPNPIPDTYNQDTELIIMRMDSEIAWGKWTDKGFRLINGSLIFSRHNEEEPGINEIRQKLIEENIVEGEDGEYTLLRDIYLHSPSTAGRLVLGQNSDGYTAWKNLDRVLLKDLLK